MSVKQTHAIGSPCRLSELNDAEKIDAALDMSKNIIKSSIRLFDETSINIGLSGGRDSRAIAALYESIPDIPKAHYYTQVPPDLEGEIAQKLINSSKADMNWELVQDENSPLNSPFKGNHIERAEYWFTTFDGDVWPSYVMRDIPKTSGDEQEGVELTGVGAEVAKPHFYTAADVNNSLGKIESFISYRSRYNPLISSHAKEDAITKLRAILFDGYLKGYSGLHLFDWFYIRSQQRRRTHLAFFQNAFTPLISPQFFWAGFFSHQKRNWKTI